jgi:hypothetical protein
VKLPSRMASARAPQTGRLGTACLQLGRNGHGAYYARYEAPQGQGGRRQPRIGPYRTEKACMDVLGPQGGFHKSSVCSITVASWTG